MHFVRHGTLFLTLGLVSIYYVAILTSTQGDWPFWAALLASFGLHVSLIIVAALGYYWMYWYAHLTPLDIEPLKKQVFLDTYSVPITKPGEGKKMYLKSPASKSDAMRRGISSKISK